MTCQSHNNLSVPGGKGNTSTKKKMTAKLKTKPTSIASVPYSVLITAILLNPPLFHWTLPETVVFFKTLLYMYNLYMGRKVINLYLLLMPIFFLMCQHYRMYPLKKLNLRFCRSNMFFFKMLSLKLLTKCCYLNSYKTFCTTYKIRVVQQTKGPVYQASNN
jgi:hypothetical protein